MAWIDQLAAVHWGQVMIYGLSAYFLGCFATGYYLVKFFRKQDIREMGSGSVGSKNVGRVMGWTGFFVTTVADVAKGALAVWVAQHFSNDERMVSLALVGVVAGHIWPAQLWFRGGKGISTSLGGLLIYDYHLVAAFLISFVVAWAVLRKTVFPGLLAFASLPLASMYLAHQPEKVLAISILAGIVLVAHRKNLSDEVSHFFERRNVQAKTNHFD